MKFIVAGILFCLSLAASAAPDTHSFAPGTSYYFEHFDPLQKPWRPGQDLNVEEVFKNYQYYEIHFQNGGREILVNRYIQNQKEAGVRYRIRGDGGLEKLAQ